MRRFHEKIGLVSFVLTISLSTFSQSVTTEIEDVDATELSEAMDDLADAGADGWNFNG